ncbi:sigma-70 family RNA polymerase sigma factor [Prosthecobacter sp.]|uniref:RNA polymerase sigma factor n=1 Tax=Prosthecobacter sp. TaxID=1965333 RepID=UPI002ABA941C|nr:sigma-70 family RNA polymerase sigma factor [Prosthecobacter sp.]MDZ4401714.1 sigma-70 family RNA polymerase sigma factor [Prosthecobacter sp.]
MDQAEPLIPATFPVTESFAFGDVPRLTTALKRGDESAFAWLHGEWSVRINRYCFALAAGDETFAGEIAQATWLRLMRHVRVMNDEPALWSWIACAARHAASDLRRKGGRYLRALSRFAEWWQPAVTDIEDDNRLPAALESALSTLTPDERALIEGRYFASESLEVIATRHALTVRAVEGRLARLRTRLRELIAEELRSSLP